MQQQISGAIVVLLTAAVVFSGAGMADESPFGLAIHGGAGTIRKADLSDEQEGEIRATLQRALDAGFAVLREGGASLDAVTATIVILEDSPLFNAGVGAVYTSEGAHELDASLMDGATLQAGAVAGVRTVKNPILLARKVMDLSPHVMLSGEGADAFARTVGVTLVDNAHFDTRFRLRQLRQAKEREAEKGAAADRQTPDGKFGTVGAVALDRNGNLAAGTSTGGMTNKRFGRVGDSPVIGAGTYADNAGCAVSATGHGEYFIRHAVAHDICARRQYLGVSLAEAADQVVMGKLVSAGGSGGVIAIDTGGNVALPFNTEGMYRGYRLANGDAVIEIYADD